MVNKKNIYILTGSEGSLGKIIKNYYKSKKIDIVCLDSSAKLNHLSLNKSKKIDLSSETQIKNLFNELEKKKIFPKVLINCAGYFNNFPILSFEKGKLNAHSLKNFDKIMKSNLYSSFLMSVNYSKLIISNKKKGLIINFSSISSGSNVGQIAYSIAKSSVETLNKSLVKELGNHGIRSVCLSPGFFETASTFKVLKKEKIREIVDKIPIKRLGKTKEILLTLDFIIKNEYVNGNVLKIDGGINI
jgi:3-oxoacyl-[acyl-carrier protein] reductase